MDFTHITDELYDLISTRVIDIINERQANFNRQRVDPNTRHLNTFDHLTVATEQVNRQTDDIQHHVTWCFRRSLPKIVPEAALWFKAEPRPITEWVWVVSPYAYSLTGQAIISIALQQADTLVIGMLVNLSNGELLTGVAGEGCQLDDTFYTISPKTLPVADRSMLFLLPATGRTDERGLGAGRWSDRIMAFHDRYSYPLQTNNVAENVAYYLGLVARNEVDFVMGVRFAYQDIAAGICLVEQAGGVVTDFDGGRKGLYTGDSFFAGHPALHQQFMQTLSGR